MSAVTAQPQIQRVWVCLLMFCRKEKRKLHLRVYFLLYLSTPLHSTSILNFLLNLFDNVRLISYFVCLNYL